MIETSTGEAWLGDEAVMIDPAGILNSRLAINRRLQWRAKDVESASSIFNLFQTGGANRNFKIRQSIEAQSSDRFGLDLTKDMI